MKLATASLILAATVLGACATTEPPHVNEWIQKPQTNQLYMALKTDTALNWQDASDVAEVLFVCGSSSHLATIQTQDEDKFIMDSVIAESDENFWIGGVKKTGPNGEREWDWGNGYGDGWEWITAGDIPDNQDRNDSGEQTSGVDGDGNYENWHDPFEPSNSYGAGQENCLEIKGFEIAPVKAWNDVSCSEVRRFSIVQATVLTDPTIHIGECDTGVLDIDYASGECYKFQNAYEACLATYNTRGSLNRCIAMAVKTLSKQDKGKVMKVIKHGCSN